MELSQRQKDILEFIKRFSREKGYPPSIREIGEAVRISSTSVVNYNLNILKDKGYIHREKEVSRGLRVLEEETISNVVSVPLLGRIAAGEPIIIPDDSFSPYAYDTIELTRDIIKEEQGLYALEVKGQSMVDALINDGDIVVMKAQREARNGELVAVWLKDEGATTLKKFYLEGDRVRLQPANPAMEPIYADPSDVEVRGKVMVVIRQL